MRTAEDKMIDPFIGRSKADLVAVMRACERLPLLDAKMRVAFLEKFQTDDRVWEADKDGSERRFDLLRIAYLNARISRLVMAETQVYADRFEHEQKAADPK